MSIVPMTDMQAIEQITMTGDLSRLTAEQRVAYVKYVCDSLGLNAATRPFEFQMFQGKLVMYAKKDCTEQLRKIHGVSLKIVDRRTDSENGVYTVSVRGIDKTGKRDESTGSVGIAGLRGMELANAMMKAETKAKRRLTLSICGLGFLDESEVADASVAHSVRIQPNETLRRLNALASSSTPAAATSEVAVVAPVAAAASGPDPASPAATPGWEQQLGAVATDGGGEATLEELAEQVAALSKGKRTAMQALTKAKKEGKDEAGTRRKLEEWHEAMSNTINKESMR